MGKVFSNLTHSATMSPDGTIQWNASPIDAGKNLAAAQSRELQPATSSIGDSGVSFNQPSNPFSSVVKPSFSQAASGPTGIPNAASPGLTKMGKLAVLLLGGAQGALAGRAAQEQTIAATGGRRAGGIGTGFQAGYQLPFMRAAMPLQLQQQQAETGLAQAGLQPVQVPGSNMPALPAALASKFFSPYLGFLGKTQAAQIGGQSRVQAADIGAQGRVQAAEVSKRFVPVPNVGLFDTQSRQVVPGTQQGITVTPEIAQDYELPEQFIGKPMSLQNLASLQRSTAFQEIPVQGAGGPALVNRKTGKVQSLGLGAPSLGAPREIADVNNPGQTVITTGAQALGQPGTQSASVQVPKKAAAAEVPTNVGNQKVAFNTALQHAQLLEQTLTALNNGDVRALNSLKNKFKTAFGSADVTNFSVVAQAYADEVQSMLSKQHITEGEQKQVQGRLPSNASPQQIMGALQSYKALAQSKLNMLNQQVGNAVRNAQPRVTGGGRVLVEGKDF